MFKTLLLDHPLDFGVQKSSKFLWYEGSVTSSAKICYFSHQIHNWVKVQGLLTPVGRNKVILKCRLLFLHVKEAKLIVLL